MPRMLLDRLTQPLLRHTPIWTKERTSYWVRGSEIAKEKELKLQKEGLEMFGEGMRSAAHFTKTLLAKGSQVEVAMSKEAVLGRLTTLNQAKLELTPCHDSLLRFSEAGLETLTRATNQFGAVSGNQTFHITSYMTGRGGSRVELCH